jgi:hypothetical protein
MAEAAKVPDSSPTDAVVAAVERTLSLALTWPAWDGRPCLAEGGGRLFTPNKAIRRLADHLLDHYAEVQALLAGNAPARDGWLGSQVTLASDWTPFTEGDLNEASERLRRLARIWVTGLEDVSSEEWDRRRDPNWTLREIVEHVGSAWYAEQVGNIGSPGPGGPGIAQ